MKRRLKLKRRPTRAEFGDCERRPWPPTLQRRPDGSYQPEPHREHGYTGDSMINMRPPTKANGNRGRKAGVPNLMTRQIHDAIMVAVELSKYSGGKGLVGYLRWLSEEHPKTFARSILGRLIPLQYRLNANVTAQLQSSAEIRAELIAKGIPVPEYLFKRPEVPPSPRPRLERRSVPSDPEPSPEPDEDALPREPVVRTNEPPRIYANPYSPFARSRPPPLDPPCGPPALNEQLPLPFPSTVPLSHHCWYEQRPPYLAVSNTNGEDTDGRSDDATPPPAAE